MAEVVCRVCLATGVRMYGVDPDAAGLSLYTLYRDIVGLTWSYGVRHVCYECARRLRSAHALRERGLRSHRLLRSLLAGVGDCTLTPADVEGVDRERHGLASPLSAQHAHVVEVAGGAEGAVKREECFLLETKCESPPPQRAPDAARWPVVFAESKVKREDSESECEPVSPAPSGGAGGRPRRKPRVDRTLADVRKAKRKTRKTAKPKVKVKTKESKEVPVAKMAKRVTHFKKISQFARVVYMTREEAEEDLRCRVDSFNYKMASYRCELCYRGFWQPAAFENHMLKHDPKIGSHECDICRLRFDTRLRMERHQREFHRVKFFCKKCPHSCTSPERARKHEKRHNDVVHACKRCEETFESRSLLRQHTARWHGERFACELCGLDFSGQRGVELHRHLMHRGADKPLKLEGPHCAECDITFGSREAWKRHLVVSPKHNLKETANGCEDCGETFDSAELLRCHRRRAHARECPKQYLRAIRSKGPEALTADGKQRKTKTASSGAQSDGGNLNDDLSGVPVKRSSNMCETCGLVFRYPTQLKIHQRKHTGVRPFACAECPKSFYEASQLSQHARLHTGERPFQCDLCSKRFNYKYNLERHLLGHMGIKPHKCEYCGKCFTTSSERRWHAMYVHLKKPWPKRDRSQRTRRQQV